jgi:DNA-directed RNA polymerase subunit beta
MKEAKIKSFSKAGVNLELPYLLSLPKESWRLFWEQSLRELFDEVFPIRDYTGKELELDILDYFLGEPKYESDFEAKFNNDNFEAPLKVRAQLTNLKTKEIKTQEVFMGNFPVMTERGTFIINGVERVIISQLIRSPGAFFTVSFSGGKRYFGAKIIPHRGAWLEFETEPSGAIVVKIDRKRKVPATTLLRAFGVDLSEKSIKEMFGEIAGKEGLKFIQETLKKDLTKDRVEAAVEIYQRLRPGDPATPESALDLIKNTFFNFERYDLSEVGRWRLSQRLGLRSSQNISESQKIQKGEFQIKKEDRVLKPEDVVAVVAEIIRLNLEPEAEPDQIDHLGNRRVRALHELLKDKLRQGLTRTVRVIKDRMSTLDLATVTPAEVINPRPFMAAIKEFFTSSQLAQFMDNENPLAELEHKRRLSATGPGGLARERAGFEVRDVQPSHYGRICPIQTPEGQNVGLVGHLAGYARLNKYGFLETPYFKVVKGKITKEIHYLTAYEEEKYKIAHGGVKIKNGKIIEEKVEARFRGRPLIVNRDEVDYIDVSSEQFVSVATSLIPFLQNTDANRALMGSNMQRQAVPLVITEKPLVMTGVEKRVARDSGLQLIAKEDGIVVGVDAQQIKIKSKNKITTYKLKTFLRTNQYTCFHQKPLVKKGERVKKGQILSSGGAIDGEYLALGKNVLVAFLPWRGGNFEDAIIISDRLIKDDVYTSLHIENFVCDVRETKLGPEITTFDIPNVAESRLKDLDQEGIVRIGATVGPNDILVGKISPKGEVDLTPEERLLRAIFGEKAREVKDTSLRMEYGKRGRVINVKIFDREKGAKLEPGIIRQIEVEVASLRKIQAGDKLAGRHGNKGVVSMVLPQEDMPFLEDGTPVDIILNPLGVASRMNLGQILETHLGWAAKKLNYLAVTPALSGASEEDIKKELKEAGLPKNGKVVLYDGRTGEPFEERVTVGYLYMMKLIHMVEDKIHMRSIGPYSLITQQPLGGKAQFGGQRFGEMEVWALEGYGAAYTLQEMLTIKSDDVAGRTNAYQAILKGEEVQNPNLPASFNLLVNELKALGLNVILKEKERKEEGEEENSK